jgi:hypothetical protein
MATKYRRLFYRRRFLNPPGVYGLGAILAEAERYEARWTDPKTNQPQTSLEVSVTLELADCSHLVSLSFDTRTPRQRRQALAKLDLIAEAVGGLRAACAEAFAELDAQPRPRRRGTSHHRFARLLED